MIHGLPLHNRALLQPVISPDPGHRTSLIPCQSDPAPLRNPTSRYCRARRMVGWRKGWCRM